MDIVYKLQNSINREAVDEDQKYFRMMRDRINTQLKESEDVSAHTINIEKSDMKNLGRLIISFNSAINRTVSDFVKAGDDLLNFNVNGVEDAYNAIVDYLDNIDFKNKATSDIEKVNNAFDELLPAVQMLKARLDADPDVSMNEKSSINNIYSHLSSHNYLPLGAYTQIDQTTNRDRASVRQTEKEARKAARHGEMMDVLNTTAKGTEKLNKQVQATQAKLESLNDMKDSLEATADNTGYTVAAISELEKQIATLNRQLDKQQTQLTREDVLEATKEAASQEREVADASAAPAAKPAKAKSKEIDHNELFAKTLAKLTRFDRIKAKLEDTPENAKREELAQEARESLDQIQRELLSDSPDVKARALKTLTRLHKQTY